MNKKLPVRFHYPVVLGVKTCFFIALPPMVLIPCPTASEARRVLQLYKIFEKGLTKRNSENNGECNLIASFA